MVSPIGLFAWEPLPEVEKFAVVKPIPSKAVMQPAIITPHQQKTNANEAAVSLANINTNEPVPTSSVEKRSAFTFTWAAVLFTTWVIGVMAILAYAIVQWIACARAIRAGSIPIDNKLVRKMEQLKLRLGFHRPMRMIVTSSGHGPMVFGFYPRY